MATKRTATGRTKSLAGRSKEFFDQGVFVSKKAADKFKAIQLRNFATERHWKIDDFTNATEIEGVTETIVWRPRLEALGLARLLEFHGEFAPNLVREFYANAIDWNTEEGNWLVESRVRGVTVRVTVQELTEIFGLPLVEKFDYDTLLVTMDRKMLKEDAPKGMPKVKSGWLKGEYVALLKSVCANIMPIMHDKEYNREMMRVAYAIASGIPTNIPAIMIAEMVDAITTGSKRASLPFPGVITELLRRAGIAVGSFAKGKARISTDIDATTVRKAIRATEAGGREGAQPQRGGADTDTETDVSLSELGRMVRGMDERLTRMEQVQERQIEWQERMLEVSMRNLRLNEDAYLMRRSHHPADYEFQPDYTPYDQPGSSSGPQ